MNKLNRLALSTGVLVLAATGIAVAVDNFPINTFGGTRTVIATTDTAGVHTLKVISTGTAPSSSPSAGIVPVVSAALESNHVIKASPGNLYSAYVTTGATPGWFLVANATSAPAAGGAAIAPIACVVAPASSTVSISSSGSPPIVASVGITLVFSTSGCLTNTASATAFFSGMAQ